MPDNSFDIVSKIDLPEVNNAIQQAMKEVITRYDLKNSKSDIQLNEKDNKITLASADEFKLKAVTEILEQKLAKRGVPLKGLMFGPVIALRQLQRSPGSDAAAGHSHRESQRDRKDDQGQQEEGAGVHSGRSGSRHGKDRDSLQEIIALLRGQDFGIDMKFDNYRTN